MQPSQTSVDLVHIATMTNLQAAWRAVRRKRGEAGLDGVTLQDFQNALETRLQHIQQALRAHTYRPEALRHVVLSKRDGGQRHIGVPTVADRVVQHAILNVLEPCFAPTFRDCSYGYRPGRSAHQAVRAIMQSLEAGCRWVVEADLEDFFDSLDWAVLRQALAAHIADQHVLTLIHRFVQTGILRGPEGIPRVQGTPQGVGVSPLLANAYLTSFDRVMMAHGYRLVRYGDDFVSLHHRQHEARTAFSLMREVLEGQLKLRLHRDKTCLTDSRHQAFEFLSFRFQRTAVVPAPSAVQRLQAQICHYIDTTHGQGRAAVIARLNPLIRGWGEYFTMAQSQGLYQQLDAWIATQLGMAPGDTRGLASLSAIRERYQTRQQSRQ